MIIERNVEVVEKGINEIISTIQFHKECTSNCVDINSIGAVKGHLSSLQTIEVLEDVLRMFHINSYEYDGNTVKILCD